MRPGGFTGRQVQSNWDSPGRLCFVCLPCSAGSLRRCVNKTRSVERMESCSNRGASREFHVGEKGVRSTMTRLGVRATAAPVPYSELRHISWEADVGPQAEGIHANRRGAHALLPTPQQEQLIEVGCDTD